MVHRGGVGLALNNEYGGEGGSSGSPSASSVSPSTAAVVRQAAAGALGNSSSSSSSSSNGHVHAHDDDDESMVVVANGHSNGHSNGSSSSNSSSAWGPQFKREEVVRLMIQAMNELGYTQSAHLLEQESSYVLENPSVASFRLALLNGRWEEVEDTLPKLTFKSPEDLVKAKLCIREQKFLELLERRDQHNALVVLRTELATLGTEAKKVNKLASFMMCSSAADLCQKAHWDGAAGSSRALVLSQVQQYLSPTSMMLDGRLQKLLQQAQQYQIDNCIMHNVNDVVYTLYEDHLCNESNMPQQTLFVLQGHTDEVWHVAYSHDGRYIASASRDTTVIIWSVELRGKVHVLAQHSKPVSNVAWSPDDAMLLTSSDTSIKLWNTSTGRVIADCYGKHDQSVTGLTWMPDNRHFISAGLDRKMYLWDLAGNVVFSWNGSRISDFALSSDASKIVAITQDKKIVGYRINDSNEEFQIQEADQVTCISLSKDGRYALVNLTSNQKEIHLWDLERKEIHASYNGQHQQRFVIRSCFGGYNESFVLSGSEDGQVYLWHRDSHKLMQVFSGHMSVVNSVAWSPVNYSQFASASDDGTVRVWGPESAAAAASATAHHDDQANGSSSVDIPDSASSSSSSDMD